MYRDSRDTKVAAAGILVKTGRKWQAQEAVTKAEARLRHKTLVGSVATGRAGLGCFPKPRYDLARGKERRRLIQDKIRAEVEEERYTKMAGMVKQGAWTRWEHADPSRITWAELWKTEPLRIKFLVQFVYDVLPSPANLHTWGLADTPECKLCQKRGTLEHILSSCSKALGEGRTPSAQRSSTVRPRQPPNNQSPSLELGRRNNTTGLALQGGSSPPLVTGSFKST